MPQPLGGSGVGLPPPQNLYPSYLNNAAQYDVPTNEVVLSPGDAIAVPAGTWFVTLGSASVLQFKDPVTGIWRSNQSARNQMQYVKSDGVNVRMANFTGCPICAVVTNAGSGYAQSTTTVTPGTGNSTWQAIVGGMVSVTSVTNAGSGYAVAPLVMLSAPPSPGVQATAYAVLTSGTVSGVTMTNWGAGYTSAPTATIVPSPFDPNFLAGSAITPATVTVGLFGSGSIAAILCTNPGVSLSAAPTLTIAGAGASATAVAQRLTAMTGATVFSAGAGFTGGGLLLTIGGVPTTTPVNTNPTIEQTNFRPRPAQALLAAPVGASLASVSTIYDSGLFLGTVVPSAIVVPPSGSVASAGASVVVLTGGVQDQVLLQAAP